VTPFARGHLPVGAVHQGGVKMAKSTGNLTLAGDLLGDHPPAVVRLLVLDRVWHEPSNYEPAATEAVTAALLTGLAVPRAVAVARDAGGEAARLLIRVLTLA